MKLKLFNLMVSILLIVLTACGFPAAPTGSGPADNATPTQQTAAPEEEEIRLPPADYVDVLNEKIASGEWTREEGLVTFLKFFAGEISVEESGIDSSSLSETEGSGIAALSYEYLKNGSDEAAKAEITRLLKLLIPTPDALARYSQEDTGQNDSAQKVAAPRLQAQDCAALWRDGFPDDRTPSFPCFLANSQTINGNTYRVFFPSAWAGDAVKARYYELTRQAIADSVTVMQRYGQMRPIYFVFTYLASEENATFLAMTAWEDFQPGVEACPVLIYPNSLSLSDTAYLQNIAHEIFHCFTSFNLRDQAIGAGYESSAWWVESAAEYFSNLVYPEANYEYRFLEEFNANSLLKPLTSMDYENSIFFQFLENQIGVMGIMDFLRTLPTTPGGEKQRAALASYPNMANLFEQFAQEFLDNRIRDTSGSLITSYTPQFPDSGIVTPGMTMISGRTIFYRPFFLLRYKVTFQQGYEYLASVSDLQSRARIQFRLLSAPRFWQPAGLVDAGCANLEYVFYVLGTTGGYELGEVAVDVTSTEHGCTANACLVGSWQLDNENYLNYLRSVPPAPGGAGEQPAVQLVTGQMVVSFDGAGKAIYEYRSFTAVMSLPAMQVLGDTQGPRTMWITMNGAGSADYETTETTLTTKNALTNLEFKVWLVMPDGSTIEVPGKIPFDQNTFASAPTSGSTSFLCMEDILMIDTPDPAYPSLLYTRLP